MEDNKDVEILSNQDKVISLFEFIKELNKIKQKVVLNVKDYLWHYSLSALPDDPENIKVSYRDRVEEEAEDTTDVLLSVRKPEFQSCPEPDALFREWILPGWDDWHTEANIRHQMEAVKQETEEESAASVPVQQFTDDPARAAAYESWIQTRSVWAEKQKVIESTRAFFTKLYDLYYELQREAETEELIVANGILCDARNKAVQHPVLTHRVELCYDANEDVVSIKDTESTSELYSVLLQTLEGINQDALGTVKDELRANDYHPLDRKGTPSFLESLVHQLSAQSVFSENGIPSGWEKQNRLLLYFDPCYIIRKRLDGTPKAIESIIEKIQQSGMIPAPIIDLVSGGKIELQDEPKEESIEEQLAAVGGESADVLLSKEANKEQLEIAQRIERYNAVLVQGPPGTGKTHTIANLMGHFLAQGKSVLVTSYTKKALSVLKDKVAPGLQNLCVSILDDSNQDMERSVDGITDYMSKTTSDETLRQMRQLEQKRNCVIKELADVRRKLFAILNQECGSIVYNGESISSSEVARFVAEHMEDLSYIPGKVREDTPFPLSDEEAFELYRSNGLVSETDEKELLANLPAPEDLPSPLEFENYVETLKQAQSRLDEIQRKNVWRVTDRSIEHLIDFDGAFGKFTLFYPKPDALNELLVTLRQFPDVEPWMKVDASDGKNGGAYARRWEKLIEQIQDTCRCAQEVIEEQLGIDLKFDDEKHISDYKAAFEGLRTALDANGKIPWLQKMLHKDYVEAQESVKLNGKMVQNAQDCEIVLHAINLKESREKCAGYWDDLMATQDAPKFFELDALVPERIAYNWIPRIQYYLNWYKTDYADLLDKMLHAGMPSELIFSVRDTDSDFLAISKIFNAVQRILPDLCECCQIICENSAAKAKIRSTKNLLLSDKRVQSRICSQLAQAVENRDVQQYRDGLTELETMHTKYALQRGRVELLNKIRVVAPQWADAIRNREGIHGNKTVPETIRDAWKWKQFSAMIDELTAKPFEQLQADSLRLSKEYRESTAEYAEKCGWYHLLKKTETNLNMKQALQGWKQTVKRIGKGTGKSAPMLKAKARELMSKCQGAVPCWIMPINRVLDSLNPKENQFDVVIIDEASQSDISSLAILYMGKKFIVVGDDKQVSPMGIGAEEDKMAALEQTYIKDKIPNSHLYNVKTSIYDIAATTFQPLMLREHFRCVPEIIGFSNMISYDYKIKPLRDASNSILLPAVVNYRVRDGQRMVTAKTNPKEAQAIAALIAACIEQKEYKGKSFGAISLLGNEQAKLIQQEVDRKISRKEIADRKILCGDSASFQGDERDVIFLSVVDSNNGDGPLSMVNFGANDMYRKRYNVAASRARDQLWVVSSLDPVNDLKPGDIRKRLVEYAINPHAADLQHEEIEKHSESPFESAVAKSLADRGYHLVQQWKVGAYRLDMVALCGKKTVAIECDGERWHSGEEKIREDMERQTILERLGWRFIRIRGSEYFRCPEKTIERVVSELKAFGIEPESTADEIADANDRNTELLQRVENRAAQILAENQGNQTSHLDMAAIRAALDPKTMIPEEKADQIEKLSIPVAVERKTEKSDTTLDRTKKTAQPTASKVDAKTSKAKAVATKLTVKKPAQKAAKPTTTSETKSSKKKQEIQQISFEDVAIIELLESNHVKFTDNRSTSGAIWLMGGHELDAVVEKASSMGIKFEFKGHWWKSV
ncbi:MAG: AAA domain-containing protein [Faecalibacterium sp.]